ncbi:PTS system mannose/fructose/sorbose family transporter subunit IID [Candidatus Palauibacter polyketidifaciens]|uniref:PTS system mannose/fructose/sorbose family transporter subunit IID n=1 Tax=Candidatus Palauibacter polyketidifaciens TaxID=3056740 RepID=UPI002393B737|nr:PTS system mannose/fructose/sorbose family transporter subunit IID [Candidatus Palauibacter polyketidifaciens]MDE2719648.1 PTS system mannose/fructose/sorbose family transporter subunit IID [Candidatus Palauibacter polyketidifaciens]
MMPRKRDFARAISRSFSIQGSWNDRTMTGPGMAHALAPLLARIHEGDPAAFRRAVQRHSRAFNAHPYLAPVAIGALARLEFDGEDPDTLLRFRSALRAPLGALGDGVAWAGWRPFCASAAGIGFLLGLDPLFAAGSFLLLYNAGHVTLRVWGLRCGWRSGRSVASVLKRAPLRRIESALVRANQVLIGVLAALLVGRLPGTGDALWRDGGAVIAALMGYLVPRHISAVAMASLLAACAVWLL